MKPVLYLVGDSICVHYTDAMRQFLGDSFEIATRKGHSEAIQNLDHPRGANCGDSSMVLAFLEKIVLTGESAPDIIAFNCGLHDVKTDPQSYRRQIEPDEYGQNLDRIITLLSGSSVKPIWINTTPVPDARHREFCQDFLRFEKDVELYNSIAAEKMQAAQIPIVDLHGFTARLGPDIYTDHVHYDEPTRKLQAAYLSGAIQAIA